MNTIDSTHDRETDTWITPADLAAPREPEPSYGTWVDTNRDVWQRHAKGSWSRLDARTQRWVPVPEGWDLVHWHAPLRPATTEDVDHALHSIQGGRA